MQKGLLLSILLVFSYTSAAFSQSPSDNPYAAYLSSYRYQTVPSPGSICSIDSDALTKLLANSGEPFPQSRSLQNALHRSEILVAGEAHLHTSLKAREEIVRLFKEVKGSRACIALELPNEALGLDGLFNLLKSRVEEFRNTGQFDRIDPIELFLQYYTPMVSYPRSLGLKVFPVDHQDSFTTDLSLEIRNNAMVTSISELLQNKTCSAILLFVGKAHETHSPNYPKAISELLRKRSHSVVTLNMQMTHELSLPSNGRTWNTCGAPYLNQSVVISDQNLLSDIRLMPDSQEEVKFSDFDYTWLLSLGHNDVPSSHSIRTSVSSP